MSEDQDKKSKKSVFSVITTMFMISISFALFIFLIYEINKNYNLRSMLIENESNVLSKIDRKTEVYQEDIEKLKRQKGVLLKQLDDCQDPDETLSYDIVAYIKSKYTTVPKTVAVDIASNVVKYSKEYNMSPELVVGIIEVESNFNPMAISSKKARGLMQLMPEWAKKFDVDKVSEFHNIDTNIKYGIQVLKIHINDDGKGNIAKGLYYYVGKSDTYADKVFVAIGKFVSFRYKTEIVEENIEEEKLDIIKKDEEENATIEGTKADS